MALQLISYRPVLDAYDRALLVDRLRGTLPVLLACGHDGTEQPEGSVPESASSSLRNAIFSQPATSMTPTSPEWRRSCYGNIRARRPTS